MAFHSAESSKYKFIFVLLIVMATNVSNAQAPSIHYTLAMPKPHTHIYDVTLRFDGLPASDSTLEVSLPVWRSGRYTILDLPAGIVAFAATNDRGESLSWKKINKSTWRVGTGGARSLAIKYHVYANEFSLRTRGLNADRGFVDGAAVFMYAERYRWLPLSLRVEPFGEWHVTTGLQQGAEANTFVVPHYDHLADCPLEIGTQKDIPFTVLGKEHVLSITGTGFYDSAKVIQDISTIIKTQAEFWGDLPYERYVFFLAFSEQGRGGTEHLNSCVMGVRPFALITPAGHGRFLGLVSHEFFHTWNVKRLRPAAINTYDWQKESYSEEYWVSEGLTSYYDELLLLRAGLIPEYVYLQNIGSAVERDRQRPGNLRQSLAEASFDAWIKHWRAGGQLHNYETDYYDRGAMVGLALDLMIRQLTDSKGSLDDVMRVMYKRFPMGKGGFTNHDLMTVCSEVAGKSMQEFFNNYIYGAKPLPIDELLLLAGYTFEDAAPDPHGWLGITTADGSDGCRVTRVDEGSPAYHAGVNLDDVIIALDGLRVRTAELNTRIEAALPGTSKTLTLFRDGQLRDVSVEIGKRMPLRLVPVAKPTKAQRIFKEHWLAGKR